MKKQCKIYLLQGNLFYSYIFKQNLINLGYTDISCYNTIAECLNNIDRSPDIIFYDYDVDFLDGEEVLKMIKRFYPDIYLLFSCGPEDSPVISTFLKYGAFDFFIKGGGEMKKVESILTNIHHVKNDLQKKSSINFLQNQINNLLPRRAC
jgi:response regulator of citrate/malate metabolism